MFLFDDRPIKIRATINSTNAVATQRHGWRAGIARILAAEPAAAAGAPVPAPGGVLTVGSGHSVDLRCRQSPRCRAPLVEDLSVDPVTDQLLQRVEDRLGERATPKHRAGRPRDRDAVRRR